VFIVSCTYSKFHTVFDTATDRALEERLRNEEKRIGQHAASLPTQNPYFVTF